MFIPLKILAYPPFTDDKLVAFCVANPELGVERTSALISANNSELIGEIGIWSREYKAGRVLGANAGFFLRDSSMRVPDVAWIHIDRWNAMSKEEKNSFPYMAPDFVVELKSKGDSLAYLQQKLMKWIKNGVRLAWLVCPDSRTTYVYEPGKHPLAVHFEETLSGGEVLVGLSTRLSDILEY